MESSSPLLELPSELRVRIYEHVLSFSRPLKLRQTVAGSADTALLRVNHQIHEEAQAVLYDVNSVAVTRNDFCTNTDAALKTPIPSQHVRHLLVTSFNVSLACNFEVQCDGCKAPASGFLMALKAMPRLKSVLVDYVTAHWRFGEFQTSYRSEMLQHTSVGVYTLIHEAFGDVDITFHHGPLGRIWAILKVLPTWPHCDEIEENKVLAELPSFHTGISYQSYYADLPDKLWLIIWTRSCPFVADYQSSLEVPLTDPQLQALKFIDMFNTFDTHTSGLLTPRDPSENDTVISHLLHGMIAWTPTRCRSILDELRTHSRMQEAARMRREAMDRRG